MKKIKEYDYVFITVVCALVIIGVVFYLQEVLPFGKHSLLTIDFFHQYGPMMGELYDRITGGENLIYSFSMGMGLPFFRNFLNYLSSPFNIIMLLFSKEGLLTSYSIIIGLKAVCSAGTMSIFLNKKFKKNYLFIVLSLLYAFSSYFVAYYFNIMWLDGMVFLPLITFGIERIVDRQKPCLYIISLAMMLYANYFIGYMLCIFSVIYFIMYLVLKTDKFDVKETSKKVLLFTISSLIAGGLCAVFLLPMYSAMSGISATGDSVPLSQYYAFTFKEFIFNHLSGVGPTVLKSDITNAPNISVGVVSIMLVLIFILNKEIPLKTKVCYMCLIGFMILSFVFAPLDYVWHAFHVPNDLPYRYSFIYSFLLILVSGYAVNKIKYTKKNVGTFVFIITLGFITFAKKLNFINISDDMIVMNYVLAIISYVAFLLSDYKKIKYPLIGVFTIVCSASIVIGLNNNWDIDQDSTSFYSDYEEMQDLLSIIKDNDKSFYRVERDDMLTFNDPSWYKYNGIIAFSSMEYEDLSLFMHYMGMPSNEINSFYFKYNTPIFNILLGLKYVIGYNYLYDYEKLHEGAEKSLYESIYEPSLMYASDNDLWSAEIDSYYPFDLQNTMIENITGVSDVLKPIDVEESQIIYQDGEHTLVKYSFKNNYNNFYIYLDHEDVDYFVIENNLYYLNSNYNYGTEFIDEEIYSNIDYNEKYIISDVSNYDVVDLYVSYNYYDGDVYDIYEIDYDKWNNAYEYLKSNGIAVDEFHEDYISTNVSFDNNKSIYTSIPYDDGWTVYVDNKQVETYKIADALLGFDVGVGNHKIELKYKIPHINMGLGISCVALICLITILVKNKRK